MSIHELLERRAVEQSSETAYLFLDREGQGEALTFAALHAQARRVAALLGELSAPGDRVLLMFPPGLGFVPAFYGSLLARVVPIAAYPPDLRLGPAAFASLRAIMADAGVSLIVAPRVIVGMLAGKTECRTACIEDALTAPEGAVERSVAGDADLAYLQYTSGSTGSAKGVRITHGNALAQCRQIIDGFGVRPDDRCVSWLPVHHSFGLIAGVLVPLYLGITSVQMSPLTFLERPSRWLQAISAYGGTVTGGPNFALDMCARSVPREDMASFDLRRLRVIGIAGEPVRADTLRRFVAATAPAGFDPGALRPSLGISEATLAVSATPVPRPPLVVDFDADAIEHGRVTVARPETARRRTLVGLGAPLPGQRLEIVADAGSEIGEVWTAGPNVSQGYWAREEESARVFGGTLPGRSERFLRTGDLGFLHGGELFLVGRAKDLIIVRGCNYHPEDLEQTVERSLSLPPQSVVAFSVDGPEGEEVAVAVEVAESDGGYGATVSAVRAALSEQHHLRSGPIVCVRRGTLPRTASAKLQRGEARRRFATGALAALHADAPVPEGEGAPEPATMRDLLARVLRLNASLVPDEATLVSLGMDSLAKVELHELARERLGVDVPYAILLDASTRVADIVGGNFAAQEDPPPARCVGLAADLVASVRPDAPSRDAAGAAPRRVLVTGATGYLGGYIVRELLRQTSAEVACLVRAGSQDEGRDRVLRAFGRSAAHAPGASDRLSAVVGDFTLPRLGMAESDYRRNADAFDAVIHCGAWVNFIYPYRVLAQANVGALEEVLRFAATGRDKVVHHMSSTAVLFAKGYERGVRYPEQHPLASDGDLPNGYEQTKWVADKNVEVARERGFNVSNYRIGYVTGTSDAGQDFRLSDFFPAMIKGCIQLGVAPDLDTLLPMVPIDYAAAAIVRIITQPHTHGRSFHINHPRPLYFADVVRWIREYGYPLELMPFSAWRERITATMSASRNNALYPYVGFVRSLRESHVWFPDIDVADTRAAVSSLECPSSYELLARYFDMFHRVGYLPPPEG